jgi:hypothetical protein
MLKKITMVVGLETATAPFSLKSYIEVIEGDLPGVVSSDEQVTKMHDSLPTALFRFETLLKLYESRELAWVTCFFPWVLINEAMSHKNGEICDCMA